MKNIACGFWPTDMHDKFVLYLYYKEYYKKQEFVSRLVELDVQVCYATWRIHFLVEQLTLSDCMKMILNRDKEC